MTSFKNSWVKEQHMKLIRTTFFISMLIGSVDSNSELEGKGNPRQCSCLENPRDGGAWWAAVYGVSQSWTQLKRRSSSSLPAWYPLTRVPLF